MARPKTKKADSEVMQEVASVEVSPVVEEVKPVEVKKPTRPMSYKCIRECFYRNRLWKDGEILHASEGEKVPHHFTSTR